MKFNKKLISLSMMVLVAPTFLFACNEEPVKKWYEYTEAGGWWNYCSSGVEGEEATEEDIGKTVKITLNGLEHEVRLIDINHDDLSLETGKAHCTFEFVNFITKYIDPNNIAYITIWDGVYKQSGNNYNFPYSVLNLTLNDGDGEVYKMFPKGEGTLFNKIVFVNKKVNVYNNSKYSPISYACRFFPLAREEIENDTTNDIDPIEGYIYKYYQQNPDPSYRIKSPVGLPACNYFLRSPSFYDKGYVYGLTDKGAVAPAASVSRDEFPVAPAFCI